MFTECKETNFTNHQITVNNHIIYKPPFISVLHIPMLQKAMALVQHKRLYSNLFHHVTFACIGMPINIVVQGDSAVS
jgi:hypothetical protein